MNAELYELACKTVQKLNDNNLKISTAESCTGGMVSEYLTSVPGVSSVFELGVTSYSCRIKNKILKVKKETLDTVGAISRETAAQMAINIKKISDSDIGISVTGAAGPDGSEGHQPGLAYIGISYNNYTIVKELKIPSKGRNYVRENIVKDVFKSTLNCIEGMIK